MRRSNFLPSILVCLYQHRTCLIAYVNSPKHETKVRRSSQETQGHPSDNANGQWEAEQCVGKKLAAVISDCFQYSVTAWNGNEIIFVLFSAPTLMMSCCLYKAFTLCQWNWAKNNWKWEEEVHHPLLCLIAFTYHSGSRSGITEETGFA